MSIEPLAARMRPSTLEHFIGQRHLFGTGKPLNQAIEQNQLHSMVFWGPPGTGKTTLARLLAQHIDAEFVMLSAIFSGVKDIRKVVETAKASQPRTTILFIDEIHRFNKAQQDVFLPFVESGVITLIGATTENPSFELNNALLSRCRVYVLKRLTDSELCGLLRNALLDEEHGLGETKLEIGDNHLKQLAAAADGDGRRALNYLELTAELASAHDCKAVDDTLINAVVSGGLRRFDKQGEYFYDQISALHKAVRGSSPDAALYWYCRMIDGGCDPLYIARRVVRMASEDIGNADPRALTLALNAWDVYERLGSPEGELAIAQAIIYLAVTAKSNATYSAYKKAMRDVKTYGSLEVPMALRNAPTKLMKSLDYGKRYRYAHDEDNAYAPNENYFPDDLPTPSYYEPTDRGLEIKIREKLKRLRQIDSRVKQDSKTC